MNEYLKTTIDQHEQFGILLADVRQHYDDLSDTLSSFDGYETPDPGMRAGNLSMVRRLQDNLRATLLSNPLLRVLDDAIYATNQQYLHAKQAG